MCAEKFGEELRGIELIALLNRVVVPITHILRDIVR